MLHPFPKQKEIVNKTDQSLSHSFDEKEEKEDGKNNNSDASTGGSGGFKFMGIG